MKKAIAIALTAMFILPGALFAAQEEVKMTTYYPAPYGEYQEMEVQGDTSLASSTG